jgi:hypothetical protein
MEFCGEDIEIRNLSLAQHFEEICDKLNKENILFSKFDTFYDIIKKIEFGRLFLIDHKRIKENKPKIIQFRSSMEKCRGFCETNNGKIAVYGTNKNKQNVINILCQRYRSIKMISEIRHINENSVEIFSDLVKLCSDKIKNLFILSKNKILVCDIDLQNCKRVIQFKKRFIAKDIFYFKENLYVLNENDSSVEIYSVKDINISSNANTNTKTIYLVDRRSREIIENDDNNEIAKPKSILVTDGILIAYAVDKNIYIYNFDDVGIDLKKIIETKDSDTKICLAENCLFTLEKKDVLSCFEIKKLENNDFEYVELYNRKILAFNGKKMTIEFSGDHILAVSEDESLIVLV